MKTKYAGKDLTFKRVNLKILDPFYQLGKSIVIK